MAKSRKKHPLRTLVLIAIIAGLVAAIRNSSKDKGGSYSPPDAAPVPAPAPSDERLEGSGDGSEQSGDGSEQSGQGSEQSGDGSEQSGQGSENSGKPSGPRPARDYATGDEGSIANRMDAEFGRAPKHSRDTP